MIWWTNVQFLVATSNSDWSDANFACSTDGLAVLTCEVVSRLFCSLFSHLQHCLSVLITANFDRQRVGCCTLVTWNTTLYLLPEIMH